MFDGITCDNTFLTGDSLLSFSIVCKNPFTTTVSPVVADLISLTNVDHLITSTPIKRYESYRHRMLYMPSSSGMVVPLSNLIPPYSSFTILFNRLPFDLIITLYLVDDDPENINML